VPELPRATERRPPRRSRRVERPSSEPELVGRASCSNARRRPVRPARCLPAIAAFTHRDTRSTHARPPGPRKNVGEYRAPRNSLFGRRADLWSTARQSGDSARGWRAMGWAWPRRLPRHARVGWRDVREMDGAVVQRIGGAAPIPPSMLRLDDLASARHPASNGPPTPSGPTGPAYLSCRSSRSAGPRAVITLQRAGGRSLGLFERSGPRPAGTWSSRGTRPHGGRGGGLLPRGEKRGREDAEG
jgi:hypothetical protein